MVGIIRNLLLISVLLLQTHGVHASEKLLNAGSDTQVITKNTVVAGLVVKHGELIDGLQPIYRNINNDGTLGEPLKGKHYGNYGGDNTKVYNDGYVLVGMEYYRGYWMNAKYYLGHSMNHKKITGLSLFFRKWTDGKPQGDFIKVGNYGLVNKIHSAQFYEYSPEKDTYITDLVYRSDVSFFTGNGSYKSGNNVLDITLSSECLGETGINIQEKIREPFATERFEHKLPLHSKSKPAIATSFNEKDTYYLLTIDIVSGTKKGQVAKAIVSFPANSSDGIQYANRFMLDYDGECYSTKETGAPKASVNDEVISGLTVSGETVMGSSWFGISSSDQHRFDINSSFLDLSQFGRSSEAFIRNGEEYFRYLHPNPNNHRMPHNRVDGAGTIKYQKLKDNIEATFNEFVLLCNVNDL